jgi:2-polyprenyl-3-methyl-5-hydroxy-6-metoxy-1,4-benzoquinol methylase
VELSASSLERLVPDQLAPEDATGREALRIGLERYAFAARHALPGRLIDCACGVGYGTYHLVEHAAQVTEAIGLDLSQSTIDYATERYAHERIAFRQGDALGDIDGAPFDTVVSIETIEHLPDPKSFVARMARVVRPGGRFIASVPTTPSVDANPYHLHDFTPRSFRALFTPHGLREIDAFEQDQPFSAVAVATRSEARMADLRTNLPAYYATHPGALASRIWSTLRHGFKNRYLTLVWERPA